MPNEKKTRLTNLDLTKVSLVASGDDPLARIVLAKAAPKDKNMPDSDWGSTITPHNPTRGKDDMAKNDKTISKDDLDPEVVAYIEALEDALDAAGVLKDDEDDEGEDDEVDTPDEVDEVDEVEEVEEEDEDPEVTKALAKADPVVASLIRKQAKALSKAERRVESAEKVAKAERTERRRRDFVEKAATLPMISTDKKNLGETLRRIDDVDPKLANEIEKLLKAANEQISKGNLFAEIGRVGKAHTISESVDSAAAEFQKADPALTYEQAVTKAYEANPALYDEDVREN